MPGLVAVVLFDVDSLTESRGFFRFVLPGKSNDFSVIPTVAVLGTVCVLRGLFPGCIPIEVHRSLLGIRHLSFEEKEDFEREYEVVPAKNP